MFDPRAFLRIDPAWIGSDISNWYSNARLGEARNQARRATDAELLLALDVGARPGGYTDASSPSTRHDLRHRWRPIAQGKRAIVFGSKTSDLVVKMFHTPEAFLDVMSLWAPTERNPESQQRAAERMDDGRHALELAARRLRRETRLRFVHLGPTIDLDATLSLGEGIVLDADKTAFVLQRRASETLGDRLLRLAALDALTGGRLARSTVDDWLRFNVRLWQRGIADSSGQPDLTYGQLDGELFLMSPGDLVTGEDALRKVLQNKPPLHHPSLSYLERVAPGLAMYARERVDEVFTRALTSLEATGQIGPAKRTVSRLSGIE